MPLDPPHPTYANIHLGAIQHNVRRLRQIAGVPVMAVVKANAYGHGAAAVARAAVEAGAGHLAVGAVGEGLALRQAGLTTSILVMGYVPPHLAAEAISCDLALTVYSLDAARAYAEAARAASPGGAARLHVKVDTGMGRLGAMPEEAADLVRQIGLVKGAAIEGVFTHFATADEADPSFAREQLRRFREVLASLPVRPGLVHAANSAAALTLPEARFDLVRTGIALYGLNPSPEVAVPDDFMPALEWKSTVAQVKTVPSGTPISYGREYVTRGRERIAVIPVGYADGFRRYPTNAAQIVVGGRRVAVVGRVCMDQIMANVSEAGEVRAGDEVVLIGRQGEARITAEDSAAWWNTNNYDVVAGIGQRVPRLYRS